LLEGWYMLACLLSRPLQFSSVEVHTRDLHADLSIAFFLACLQSTPLSWSPLLTFSSHFTLGLPLFFLPSGLASKACLGYL
jgi:hypothetical protein